MSGTTPTAASYIAWARGQGCSVTTLAVTRGGQGLVQLEIQAPSGRGVVEIVLERDEPLMSTTIARLDRRLGLRSYLFT